MANKINLAALSFLVASNNAQERQAAKDILHILGARNIRLVKDGSEAITEMKTFPADVVFCDWEMSPVNGLQFTQRIRAEGKGIGQFAVIIALYGELSQQLVIEARDVGVNDFIAKPISMGSVTSRLHRVFDNPKGFVRSDTYFGPDRRRRDAAFEGEEQRQTPAKIYTNPLASKFANAIPGKPKPKVAKVPQPRPVEPPPAAKAPRPAVPKAPPPSPRARFRMITVLVVADNGDPIEELQSLLLKVFPPRFAVQRATSYTAAIEAIAEETQDICFVGKTLIDGTALKFISEANTSGWCVPIVMVSDFAEIEVRFEAFTAGAIDCLDVEHLGTKLLSRAIHKGLVKRKAMLRLRNKREEKILFKSSSF
ncbi:MAG: hypothetical protein CMF63_03705 [Magnetovibrio sp.]|nr:hypothetical protein [Magnetovibrio sp.]